MAILQILKAGDETLRKKSREVTEITPRVLRLLDDMLETLREAAAADLPRPRWGCCAGSWSSRPRRASPLS